MGCVPSVRGHFNLSWASFTFLHCSTFSRCTRKNSQSPRERKVERLAPALRLRGGHFLFQLLRRCTIGRDPPIMHRPCLLSGDFRTTLPSNWFIHQPKMQLPHPSCHVENTSSGRYARVVSPNFVSEIVHDRAFEKMVSSKAEHRTTIAIRVSGLFEKTVDLPPCFGNNSLCCTSFAYCLLLIRSFFLKFCDHRFSVHQGNDPQQTVIA